MAEPRRGAFLRGLRNVAGRIGDRLVWGQNFDPQTGRFTATPAQVIGGIGSRALNFVLPGAGTAANIAGNAYYGSGPLGGLFNRPQRLGQQISDFQASVTPPSLPSMYQPANLGLPSGFMPSPYGPYASGYQFPGQQIPAGPDINPISGLPNTQAGYGVNLPNYGQIQQPATMPTVFANASRGSGGPFQSTFINDPWGETAAGFGIGIGAPGQTQQLALPDVLGRGRAA